MAYRPLVTGGVVVELDKGEYEDLIRKAEKIGILERLLNSRDYVSSEDIMLVLGVERKAVTENAVHN